MAVAKSWDKQDHAPRQAHAGPQLIGLLKKYWGRAAKNTTGVSRQASQANPDPLVRSKRSSLTKRRSHGSCWTSAGPRNYPFPGCPSTPAGLWKKIAKVFVGSGRPRLKLGDVRFPSTWHISLGTRASMHSMVGDSLHGFTLTKSGKRMRERFPKLANIPLLPGLFDWQKRKRP